MNAEENQKKIQKRSLDERKITKKKVKKIVSTFKVGCIVQWDVCSSASMVIAFLAIPSSTKPS